MSGNWGVWFAVSGDLRFLSHHDLMRLMARAAARASLPLKNSEGFHPRPRLALVPPRPVGVASRGDLMVIQLTDPLDAGELCRRLNEQLPPDVRVSAAAALPSRRCPQVRRIRYRVSLDEAESAAVAERIDALARMDQWTVNRPATVAGPGRTVDLTGGAEELAVEGQTLRFALRAAPAGMPRCADVLALLGLTGPGGDRVAATEALARAERTDIEYDLAPGGP